MKLTLLALIVLVGCSAADQPQYVSNPLLGTWRAEVPTPFGYFSLGRWTFAEDQMTVLGMNEAVDYAYSGDSVRVIPRDFGPELELRMLDRDVAKLKTSFTGDILGMFLGDVLTLRRVDAVHDQTVEGQPISFRSVRMGPGQDD